MARREESSAGKSRPFRALTVYIFHYLSRAVVWRLGVCRELYRWQNSVLQQKRMYDRPTSLVLKLLSSVRACAALIIYMGSENDVWESDDCVALARCSSRTAEDFFSPVITRSPVTPRQKNWSVVLISLKNLSDAVTTKQHFLDRRGRFRLAMSFVLYRRGINCEGSSCKRAHVT